MYVDPSVISYINRCSEDSRKVRPVSPADRGNKHRERSDQNADNASRRAAHHHNGRLLEDEYEPSEQGGQAGYGGCPPDHQSNQEHKQKPEEETPKEAKIRKALRQAYGVCEEVYPTIERDTAA